MVVSTASSYGDHYCEDRDKHEGLFVLLVVEIGAIIQSCQTEPRKFSRDFGLPHRSETIDLCKSDPNTQIG